MSEATAGCSHPISKAYTGMSRVETRQNDILYRCAQCGQAYVALRCAATSVNTGVRCGRSTMLNSNFCVAHRSSDALA